MDITDLITYIFIIFLIFFLTFVIVDSSTMQKYESKNKVNCYDTYGNLINGATCNEMIHCSKFGLVSSKCSEALK